MFTRQNPRAGGLHSGQKEKEESGTAAGPPDHGRSKGKVRRGRLAPRPPDPPALHAARAPRPAVRSPGVPAELPELPPTAVSPGGVWSTECPPSTKSRATWSLHTNADPVAARSRWPPRAVAREVGRGLVASIDRRGSRSASLRTSGGGAYGSGSNRRMSASTASCFGNSCRRRTSRTSRKGT